ncbi:MAG: flagellar basal body rod protein FlgC, partial [Deltaproteobacteria bacterium]|nr:flagellar basal body rod protein FlgC [Deltaproteobacteria bacterium]
PSHPDADENGQVAMPNISLVEETADMMSASRAYEANVTVVKSAKRMALKALEIGR